MSTSRFTFQPLTAHILQYTLAKIRITVTFTGWRTITIATSDVFLTLLQKGILKVLEEYKEYRHTVNLHHSDEFRIMPMLLETSIRKVIDLLDYLPRGHFYSPINNLPFSQTPILQRGKGVVYSTCHLYKPQSNSRRTSQSNKIQKFHKLFLSLEMPRKQTFLGLAQTALTGKKQLEADWAFLRLFHLQIRVEMLPDFFCLQRFYKFLELLCKDLFVLFQKQLLKARLVRLSFPFQANRINCLFLRLLRNAISILCALSPIFFLLFAFLKISFRAQRMYEAIIEVALHHLSLSLIYQIIIIQSQSLKLKRGPNKQKIRVFSFHTINPIDTPNSSLLPFNKSILHPNIEY